MDIRFYIDIIITYCKIPYESISMFFFVTCQDVCNQISRSCDHMGHGFVSKLQME